MGGAERRGLAIEPDENNLHILIRLNRALKRVWAEERPEGLVWFHIAEVDASPVDHLVLGCQERTHVPMIELRAMLRPILAR